MSLTAVSSPPPATLQASTVSEASLLHSGATDATGEADAAAAPFELKRTTFSHSFCEVTVCNNDFFSSSSSSPVPAPTNLPSFLALCSLSLFQQSCSARRHSALPHHKLVSAVGDVEDVRPRSQLFESITLLCLSYSLFFSLLIEQKWQEAGRQASVRVRAAFILSCFVVSSHPILHHHHHCNQCNLHFRCKQKARVK